jgi:hypothetical protein
MKASMMTSIGAMALVTATTAAAMLGNLRLRRRLATTQDQLSEVQFRASHDVLTGLANRRGVAAGLAGRMASGAAGWSLARIGSLYKVTKERVGQITAALRTVGDEARAA